jgi:cytosine/adenosine deaminase-related metal-dependent hydrolase
MSGTSVGRWLFTHEGVVEGYLRLEGDAVVEVCRGSAPDGSSSAIVLPGFVNAHTHIGDSFAYPAPRGTVEEIVAPPNGYKHRMLRVASRAQKVRGMRASLDVMAATGTCTFVDFREEGAEGIQALREAAEGSPVSAVVLGRPVHGNMTQEALAGFVAGCDGLGMSSLRDWPRDLLQRASRASKESGKLFGLHASEVVREDIDAILELKPDFLVHMTAASEGDIAAVAEAGIPVVVCPRSNEFFGIDPRIPRLRAAGVEVAIGTDNGMICRPDMLEELRAAFRMSSGSGGLAPVDAVRLATSSGRKVLNAELDITTEIVNTDDLVVVELVGEDPLQEVVSATGSARVAAVCRGGRLRRL